MLKAQIDVIEAAQACPWTPELQQAWEKARPENRYRIAVAVLYLHTGELQHLLPDAPNPIVAAMSALGVHPVNFSCGELTRKEAAGWGVQSEHALPCEWLWAQVQKRYADLDDVSGPRSAPVVRWVDRMLASERRRGAMARKRTGRDIDGSLLDRLDELRPADLRDSVAGTLEALEDRTLLEFWDGPEELLPAQPWEKKLPTGVTAIRHIRDLVREGAEMRHCVASYAGDIHSGRSVIISIRTPEARSTAEFVRGKLGQHKGPRNEPPHPSCVALAKAAEQVIAC